jgi:hypothetical protein
MAVSNCIFYFLRCSTGSIGHISRLNAFTLGSGLFACRHILWQFTDSTTKQRRDGIKLSPHPSAALLAALNVFAVFPNYYSLVRWDIFYTAIIFCAQPMDKRLWGDTRAWQSETTLVCSAVDLSFVTPPSPPPIGSRRSLDGNYHPLLSYISDNLHSTRQNAALLHHPSGHKKPGFHHPIGRDTSSYPRPPRCASSMPPATDPPGPRHLQSHTRQH